MFVFFVRVRPAHNTELSDPSTQGNWVWFLGHVLVTNWLFSAAPFPSSKVTALCHQSKAFPLLEMIWFATKQTMTQSRCIFGVMWYKTCFHEVMYWHLRVKRNKAQPIRHERIRYEKKLWTLLVLVGMNHYWMRLRFLWYRNNQSRGKCNEISRLTVNYVRVIKRFSTSLITYCKPCGRMNKHHKT